VSLRIHTIRGLFWSAVQRTGGQAISLVAFIVLSRLLPPSAFGLLALANAYLLVGLLLIEQGVNQALIQRADVSPEHLDAAFLLSVSISIILVLVTVLVAEPLASLFQEPMLAPVLRVLTLSFVFSGLRATQTALLQRRMQFRELALRTTVAETLGGGVGVAMALAGFGVWSLVGQALGRGLAGVVVLWRVSEWRPRFRFSQRPLRELTSFGMPVLADRMANLVQGKSDDMIVGLVLGATALGYYSVGYRLLTYVMQLMSGTVQSVALPVLSRLQEDLGRLRRVFLMMQGYLALAAFPVFVGLALVAADLVPLLFGPKWAPSIPVMQVLALAGAAKTLPVTTATLLVALGRPGLQLRINLLTTVLAVLGFALFVRQGIVAVAFVHLGVNVLLAPLHAIVAHRTTGARFGEYFETIRAPLLGALAMAAVLLAVGQLDPGQMSSVIWIGLNVLLGAAVYLGTTCALDRASFRRARQALAEGVPTWPGRQGVEDSIEGW
jgi:PST family polysaccharide transporter